MQQLNIKATSAFDADLNALRIPRALPADKAEANSYLDLLARMGQVDSALCVTAFNDFITSYPEMPDGYVYRGSYWANKNELGKANADFELAVEKVCHARTQQPCHPMPFITRLATSFIVKWWLQAKIQPLATTGI